MKFPTSLRMIKLAVWLGFIMVFCFFSCLFSHNSGFGYDALEYLVIGRSLLDGYSFYDFIPSKGCGIYLLVACFLRVYQGDSRWGVAVLCVLIQLLCFAVTILTAYKISNIQRRQHGEGVMFCSGALVLLGAMFMELNFLEPDGIVYCFGLLAYGSLVEYKHTSKKATLFLCGVFLGLGILFKSTAIFFFAGICIFLLSEAWKEKTFASFIRFLKVSLGILSGILCVLAIPVLVFSFRHQLNDFLLWSFEFPILHYPANLYDLNKIWTKLLWVVALFMGTMIVVKVRWNSLKHAFSYETKLLLFMGLASLLALFKLQAPHYFFCAASFLFIWTALIWEEVFSATAKKAKTVSLVLISLALLCMTSILTYKPAALARLFYQRDFSREDSVGQLIQKHVREGHCVIALQGGMLLYWLSHRYPNIPFITTHVQTIYGLSKSPALLKSAMADPRLSLVLFDPTQKVYDDPDFYKNEEIRSVLDQFYQNLVTNFTRIDSAEHQLVLWIKK